MTALSAPRAPWVAGSALAPAAAFMVAVVLALFPILSHVHLPMVDLPNHIARHAIMANPDGPLSTYYTVAGVKLVPNTAVDTLWRWSGMDGDPTVFSRNVMALYAVSLIGAVMVLARVVHGQWTAWAAAAALLVYNAVYFWGFQNYLVSVPFALLALAGWLASERWPVWARIAAFVPVAALLFLMHFFAFAILMLTAFGREMQRLVQQPGWAAAGRTCGLAVPFVLPLGWLVWGIVTGPPSAQGSKTEWNLAARLEALASPATGPNVFAVPEITMLGFVGYGLLLAAALTLLRKSGPRLVFATPMLGPLVMLGTVAALAPFWLNGVAFVHIRLPFVCLALLIAATRWTDMSARIGMGLAVVLIAVMGLRVAAIERLTAWHDRDIRQLGAVLTALPEGSPLIAFRAPGWEFVYRLAHAQAYAVVWRDSFVPTLFQGVHAIQVRPDWTDHAHSALFSVDIRNAIDPKFPDYHYGNPYWEGWETTFSHVLFMDEVPAGLLDGQPLRPVAQEGRFTLYAVTP